MAHIQTQLVSCDTLSGMPLTRSLDQPVIEPHVGISQGPDSGGSGVLLLIVIFPNIHLLQLFTF